MLRSCSGSCQSRSVCAPSLRAVRRLSATLVLVAGAAACGCGTTMDRPALVPGPSVLAGTLSISGNLHDASGGSTGTRVVSNASGIRVYLVRFGVPGTVVDSTLTDSGRYSFSVTDGSFQIVARTGPTVSDSSLHAGIGLYPSSFEMPSLQLTSTGSLVTSPNPFTSSMVTKFSLSATSTVGLSVFNLANLRVRTLVAGASFGSGAHQVAWDGTDDANQPVPDGSYWIVFSAGGQDWAELVFKGP